MKDGLQPAWMLEIGFDEGVLYPLLYPLFVFDTPVSDRPAWSQIHGPAQHQEMSGCGLRPTEGVREVELAWSFDHHISAMQTISVTSPTLPNGTDKIAARLLKAGYASCGEDYVLSPADQQAADISISDLHLLRRHLFMNLGEPASVLEGVGQDREGNLVFSLAFDLVP